MITLVSSPMASKIKISQNNFLNKLQAFFLIVSFFMQILEGLLKLPQNRECADCRNKYAIPSLFLIFSIFFTPLT